MSTVRLEIVDLCLRLQKDYRKTDRHAAFISLRHRHMVMPHNVLGQVTS